MVGINGLEQKLGYMKKVGLHKTSLDNAESLSIVIQGIEVILHVIMSRK